MAVASGVVTEALQEGEIVADDVAWCCRYMMSFVPVLHKRPPRN